MIQLSESFKYDPLPEIPIRQALLSASAGNYADRHTQEAFSDPENDGFHNFGVTDETIDVMVPDGQNLSFNLQWDPAGNPDYSLLLYDADLNLLDCGDGGSWSETVAWENNSGSDVVVKVAVFLNDGSGGTIEIFGERYLLVRAASLSVEP